MDLLHYHFFNSIILGSIVCDVFIKFIVLKPVVVFIVFFFSFLVFILPHYRVSHEFMINDVNKKFSFGSIENNLSFI